MWEGARNLIDLGGLALRDGGSTVHGRVWRSAAPESVTVDAWGAARSAGLTTVVDLRNAVERERVVELAGVDVVHAPTEDPTDPAFLEECGPWLDHPRSWTPNIARYPSKIARVFNVIAGADGGVLVHCAGGRDRTGMISSMLLALAGVAPNAIADDYEQGFRGAAEHRGHGHWYDVVAGEWMTGTPEESPSADLDGALADRRPVLLEFVRDTDVASYLAEAGVDAARIARLRTLLRE